MAMAMAMAGQMCSSRRQTAPGCDSSGCQYPRMATGINGVALSSDVIR